MKLSPLNEWQATSLGVGSKVTQQLLGNRQFVTCAGFRDPATLKTKATFKSKPAYLGHRYPGDNLGDIGDGKQAAGTESLCSEPRCAKCDAPCMCTQPCTESQVYGFFLCSGIWILLCCALGVLILECNVRQSPSGLGHIAGILVSVVQACGLGSANPGAQWPGREEFLIQKETPCNQYRYHFKPWPVRPFLLFYNLRSALCISCNCCSKPCKIIILQRKQESLKKKKRPEALEGGTSLKIYRTI